MLFTLIAERYERRYQQSGVQRLGAHLQDPLATAAAIDRLVHHAVILEFNVPSYRIRKRRHTDNPQTVETADAGAD